MLPYFPKQFAKKAVAFYFVSLSLVSLVFMRYAMQLQFMFFGSIEVLCFFFFSYYLSKNWFKLSTKVFLNRLFWTAFLVRIVWVIFSYFYYSNQTGKPFEWAAADSVGYHNEAVWLNEIEWSSVREYLFVSKGGYSDAGYPFYLYLLYAIIGPQIIVARFVKALLGAISCVLIYRIGQRNFGESTGRMAGIFYLLMPNLIIYTGLHLKETEMLFLLIAFLERYDYLIRSKKYTFFTILVPFVLGGSLFFFRTVLGTIAILSLLSGIIFTSEKIVGRTKKVVIIAWSIVAIAVLAGGTIMNEVENYWEGRNDNQTLKRQEQVSRGNEWAKYATRTVMAPMMFVIPFSTMVDVDEQYSQQLLHGGSYVRNVLGIFVLLTLVYALIIHKNWRNYSLLGTFAIGYLMIIAFSGFANSERFVLPALPVLLLFAAKGVSLVNKKNLQYVNYWFLLVVVMEFSWAYFKLASRGLV